MQNYAGTHPATKMKPVILILVPLTAFGQHWRTNNSLQIMTLPDGKVLRFSFQMSHLKLIENLDTDDDYLMALRRFITRRGIPSEIISDQGTNFKWGCSELHPAFDNMVPELQEKLKEHQITFHFNSPGAPHFGGLWEREIHSVRQALRLGNQSVPEPVLQTVLVEVREGLNSKSLGYVSSDVAEIDPVIPKSSAHGAAGCSSSTSNVWDKKMPS